MSTQCHKIRFHNDTINHINSWEFPPLFAITFQYLKFPAHHKLRNGFEQRGQTALGLQQQGDKPNFRAAKIPSHHGTDLFQGFVPDKGIELGRDSVANEHGSLPKLQADQLLVLQLADDAIVDGQPVNVGNEQLAGQEAALINQGIIGLCDVIFLTTCMGKKKRKEPCDLYISPSELQRAVCSFLLHCQLSLENNNLGSCTCPFSMCQTPSESCPTPLLQELWFREPATLTAQPELGQEPEEQGHAVLGV